MSKDFYKTLGVSKSASAEEIQKAYRNLARKFHPDLNPDDKTAKQKFQDVQQAYETLNDPKKKQLYDQFGSDYEQMGGGGAGPQFHGGQMPPGFEQMFGGGNAAGGITLEELMKQFGMGGGGFEGAPSGGRRRARKPAQEPGEDVRHELEIPFRTAVEGGKVGLKMRRASGKTETIDVTIPAGIESGKTIRYRGQGEPSSSGGPTGDLLITIRIASHESFSRNGLDLTVKVPITIAEACLGGKIDVPTPHGTLSLKIPPGTDSGKRIRAKGQGIHAKDGSTGDLYAEVQIVVPKKLSSKTTELVKQLADQLDEDPRANLHF